MLISVRDLVMRETVFSVQNKGYMDYTLIRSLHRTLAVQVTADGQVIVRAPKRITAAEIERNGTYLTGQKMTAAEKEYHGKRIIQKRMLQKRMLQK